MRQYTKKELLELLEKDPVVQSMKTSSFEAGDIVVTEGDMNQRLYMILEGEVSLQKRGPEGNNMHIDQLRPGDLIGLVSFVSDGPALTTVTALSDVKTIRINKQEFEELASGRSKLSPVFYNLIIMNLLNRYQHTVGLQIKFEHLTKMLNEERNQLKTALNHLEAVQKQLISQEKMALLGELAAGISHEMNNPAASLSRSIEHLAEQISHAVAQVRSFDNSHVHKLLQFGINDKPESTSKVRENARLLALSHPKLKRGLLRKLSRCSEETRNYILENIKEKDFDEAVEIYDTGQILSIMKDSTKRITALVQSLRSFSKPSTNYQEKVDVREGIQSTLQLLNHKLKHHDIVLRLYDIPYVAGNSGELNQVWTNILDNSCDALGKQRGEIIVKTYESEGRVCVQISDDGPGIPDDIKKRIFDANFTTKNTDGSFGLGIGLTITKDIIEKHKGTIIVKNSNRGGAKFQIYLPAVKSEN